MKSRSIATRILLIAMLPTLLASLLLTGWFVSERIGEIERRAVASAARLLDGAARAAETGVLAGSAELLAAVAEPVLTDESVVGMRFTDLTGAELARAGDVSLLDARSVLADEQEGRVLTSPVRLTDLSMFEEAYLRDGSVVDAQEATRIGTAWLVMDLQASWERQLAVLWRGALIGLVVMLLAAVAAWRLATSTTALLARQNGELIAAREAAEQASAAKSEFLANVSHEILTPMHSIVATLSMLGISALDDDQRRSVERAERSSQTLLDLMRDVLDNARVEAGGFELDIVDTDLAVLLDEVGETLRPRAEERGLSLVIDRVPEGAPSWLRTDPLRLKQVLFNLVANAIKFTHDGEVALRVEVHWPAPRPAGANRSQASAPGVPRWRFTVSDTGIGIPADQREAIFEPFARVDSATTRRQGGTGLGLAISREIVQRMGGTISLDSTPGQGTAVTVEVLLAAAAPSSRAMRRTRGTPGVAPTLSRPDLHVLAVDDQPVNLEILQRFCEHLGATVDVAASAAEARQRLADRRYDLVLLDLHMPDEDGFDLVADLRADTPLNLGAPVVAITADAFHTTRERAFAAGFDDVLIKPVTVHAIASAIEAWTAHPEVDVPHDGQSPAPDRSAPGVPSAPSVATLAASMFGDEPWARGALSDYRRELPMHVKALNEAFAQGDRQAIHATAHALKGASALLGVQRLVEPAETLCRASEDADWPVIEDLLHEVLSRFDAAARDCDAALATPATD